MKFFNSNEKIKENENKKKAQNSFPTNLLKCKICQNLINYEFNYEKLLENNTLINKIKKLFEKFPEKNFNFSKENLENFSKEISMEYFFKGEDAVLSNMKKLSKNFDEKNSEFNKINKVISTLSDNDLGKFFEKCKMKEINLNLNCDLFKVKFCESLIGLKGNTCVIDDNEYGFFSSNENKGRNKDKDNDNDKDINKLNSLNDLNGFDKDYKNGLNDNKFIEKINTNSNRNSKNDNDINAIKNPEKTNNINTNDINLNALLFQLKEKLNSNNNNNNIIKISNNKENELLNLLKNNLIKNNNNNKSTKKGKK